MVIRLPYTDFVVYTLQPSPTARGRHHRPGFDRMLNDASWRHFDIVMAWAIEPRRAVIARTARHHPTLGSVRLGTQSGRTMAPRRFALHAPHVRADDVMKRSPCQSSTLKVLAQPKALQVTYTDRMPRARMPPGATGWLGRSLAGSAGGFLPMRAKLRSRGWSFVGVFMQDSATHQSPAPASQQRQLH
jgi:hypothetical protein